MVFHASASESRPSAALACAGVEATVVEMSWYGDRTISAGLGGAFHSPAAAADRLAGRHGLAVPPRALAACRRLAAALDLLRDDRLDALVGHAIDFADAPQLLPPLLADGALGLAPVIRYPGAG